jgi:GTP-binding protein HflX
MYETQKNQSREKAILVAVKLPHDDGWSPDDTLRELALLTDTAGADVLDAIVQVRGRPDPATFIGEGKAEEVARRTRELEANLVIFDDDLSPAQARNLERLIDVKIVDRSGLILDIFARRAQSREAKTQVELAQLEYLLPRLTRQWTHLSRQEGGIGTRGPGETQLEVDRRRVRKRIADLSSRLKRIARGREVRRSRRRHEFTAALLGYTNAGKSTLLNALAQAGAYTEDKLFATLDPTTRGVQIDDDRKILITDTVGLIRKLPHHLVASFHSTLEVLIEADLLLHVVDASHEKFDEQMKAVTGVLHELGAHTRPMLVVFNKIDRIRDYPDLLARLASEYPGAIFISALREEGLEDLAEAILRRLESDMEILCLEVPHADSRLLSEVYDAGEVLDREDLPEHVRLKVKVKRAEAGKLKKRLEDEGQGGAGKRS